VEKVFRIWLFLVYFSQTEHLFKNAAHKRCLGKNVACYGKQAEKGLARLAAQAAGWVPKAQEKYDESLQWFPCASHTPGLYCVPARWDAPKKFLVIISETSLPIFSFLVFFLENS